MTYPKDEKAAELVGILLGDGCFYFSKYNHEVDIALDTKDRAYKNYVKSILESITRAYVWEKRVKGVNCVHLRISRKEPAPRLLEISLEKPGNKIKNGVKIPGWVWKNDLFLSACIRGLIDTDGAVYRLKPHWPNLFQISFKNNNKVLLKDVREAFLHFNLHPSKLFGNRVVITRQAEVRRFFSIIGTRNDTHLKEQIHFLRIWDKKHNIAP